MKVAQAAFIRLVQTARSDGTVGADEKELLERYRKALRLPASFADRALLRSRLQSLTDHEIEASPAERRHILQMMMRVAMHDGHVDDRERARLEEVADLFFISKVEFADIVVAVEHGADTRHGLRRRSRIAVVVAGCLLLIAALILLQVLSNRNRQNFQDRKMATMRVDLDRRAEIFAGEMRSVLQAAPAIERRESALERRIRELQSSSPEASAPTTPEPDASESMRLFKRELADLRRELHDLRRSSQAFQHIVADWNESIVLIWVMFDLVDGAQRRRRGASGTGFFVTPTGYIASAKHVIEPWKYRAEDRKLMDEGFRLDPDSIQIAAWQAGARARDAGGKYNWAGAYGTWNQSLKLERVGPERFETISRSDRESGLSHHGQFHVYDVSDVALLKATVRSSVVSARLQPDLEQVEKLAPVMLLGFPHTFSLLEGELVETAPSLGEVRKVENRIFTTAPTIGGNSGGPLFDATGAVIGIASTSHGASTLGGAVPVKYVLELLPEGPSILAQAERHEQSGDHRSALDLLLVAEQRHAPRADVEALRRRILQPCEGQIREADRLSQSGRGAEARIGLAKVLEEYGPHWGEEAARLLDEWQ